MTDIKVPKITKTLAAKKVAKFIVANSVRFVVTTAITTLVPTDSKTQKLKLMVGAYVIAEVLADKAKSYIGDEIDDAIEFVEEIKSMAPETAPDIPAK